MTGVGVSWSAPAWVGQSDKDYSDLIRKKADAVTRRDKRRGGQYTVKQAIEAIHQAFHRCNGFDPYDGSKLDPELLGTYSNERSKERGAAYKREMDFLFRKVGHYRHCLYASKSLEEYLEYSAASADRRCPKPAWV